jgi:hypothetical protein
MKTVRGRGSVRISSILNGALYALGTKKENFKGNDSA